MIDSKTKILIAAQECFFQHGYNSSNISMISRCAGLSRVTTHKYFSSKEALFCQVVKTYSEKNSVHLHNYIKGQGDFWALTKTFLTNNCSELFSSISSTEIRADLIHASQKFCQAIIDDRRAASRQAITNKLTQAITDNQLTLKKLPLSAQELANNIEATFSTMVTANIENNIPQLIDHTLTIYQAATSIKS